VSVILSGRVILSLAVVMAATIPSSARAADEFYKGKTIQISVGFAAGGGYDVYARLIARHMGKYIPGNPTFIVQNMPGAGSRVAANWLYNVAPKDGTALASVVQGTPVDQVMKERGVRFDAAKFAWIGNPIVDNLVTLSSRKSGLATLDDVKTKGGLVCGSTGAGPTVTMPKILGGILPANIRIVTGYPGVPAINLALERDEVNCLGGTGWSSMKATMSQMMAKGELYVLTQWGTAKNPEISKFAGRDVPLATEVARNDVDREAAAFISSTTALSRPLLAPPGVPADRVDILRRAFDATMKDAEFLADAKRAKADILPISGEKMQQIVDSVIHASPAAQKRAKELIE
jgi:tripartite-type tricarboxylate transporter receptor subunit TctC